MITKKRDYNGTSIIKTKTSWLALAVLLLVSLLLAACGEMTTPAASQSDILSLPVAAAPTSQDQPVATSPATATATATPTQPPTATSQPTAIPTVTPIVAPTATPAVSAPDDGGPQDYKPMIWFSASTLKVGDTLAIRGEGYPANATLNVALGFGGQQPGGSYAKPATDGQGRFSTSVTFDHSADGKPFAPGRVVVQVSSPDENIAAGASVTLVSLTTTAAATTAATTTAGSQAPADGGKWIDVNLTQQKLVAYEGNKPVFTTLISSGVARHPTVTGTFNVYLKYVKQTMIGGTGAEHYNLPDVPYVMYFYQDYGIHGAYWHHNFGHPMSHGCVNTPVDASKFLYNWSPIGTTVKIHY